MEGSGCVSPLFFFLGNQIGQAIEHIEHLCPGCIHFVHSRIGLLRLPGIGRIKGALGCRMHHLMGAGNLPEGRGIDDTWQVELVIPFAQATIVMIGNIG